MTGDRGTRVRLDGCAKTFADGTAALEPTSLAIEPGETLVFLGPSGCGKTTTLRLIAGLERPDPGGRVLFDDADVTDRPIERRHVGMVFQSYALFPNMDVAGNVGYGLRLRRMPPAERRLRVDEVLDMMRIRDLAHRRIDQLSGGQRQRVALARALAVRPRVLLLDEPLTALDAALRERLRLEIDALLRGLGITAVYVTHDQGEAMALGDRIVVMNRGRVAQVGSPRDVYFRPADAFVADFIGIMNRLAGSRRAGVVEVAGGRLPLPGPDAATLDLLFRPESVQLGEPGDGRLAGTVEQAVFLGDRTRVVVAGVGAQPLIVDAPSRQAWRPGMAVGVAIDPAALIELPS